MRKNLLAALAILALGATQASAQNLLANAGFESPTSTTTSTGNWFAFGSGAGGAAFDSNVDPRTGTGHVGLELVGANQFAGVFQLLPVAIAPGQSVTFSGWAKNASGAAFAATQEVKIEWAGAPQNRVDILELGDAYEAFSHTAVAPAGTTGATITYAISSFGAGQGDSLVYVDDFSATVIPEPTTIGMIGVALLGMLRFRRK